MTAQVTGGASGSRYYGYDGLGQLRTVGAWSAGGTDVDAYTYDAGGNRLSDHDWPTYNYTTVGRLQSRSNQGTQMSVAYGYNPAGDLTSTTVTPSSCGNRTLDYTVDGRVSQSTSSQLITGQGCQTVIRTYRYDGLGRLIMIQTDNQWVTDWGTTRFWWLDDELAVKLHNPGNPQDTILANLIAPALSRGAGGVLVALGEWFWPGLGTDQTLASFNPGEGQGWRDGQGRPHRHLFVRDWRGSVIKIVEQNGSGTVHAPQEYEAFGAADGAVARAGPGYNGAPSIDGVQYLRNRWYDPGTGRFTQEDPIGFGGGINLYAYAGSNPVSYSDPYGLDCPPSGSSGSYLICQLLGAFDYAKAQVVSAVHGFVNANAGNISVGVDRRLDGSTTTQGSVDVASSGGTSRLMPLGATAGVGVTLATAPAGSMSVTASGNVPFVGGSLTTSVGKGGFRLLDVSVFATTDPKPGASISVGGSPPASTQPRCAPEDRQCTAPPDHTRVGP